jgi:hypothetical protein
MAGEHGSGLEESLVAEALGRWGRAAKR